MQRAAGALGGRYSDRVSQIIPAPQPPSTHPQLPKEPASVPRPASAPSGMQLGVSACPAQSASVVQTHISMRALPLVKDTHCSAAQPALSP
jgi:hypothetical protein